MGHEAARDLRDEVDMLVEEDGGAHNAGSYVRSAVLPEGKREERDAEREYHNSMVRIRQEETRLRNRAHDMTEWLPSRTHEENLARVESCIAWLRTEKLKKGGDKRLPNWINGDSKIVQDLNAEARKLNHELTTRLGEIKERIELENAQIKQNRASQTRTRRTMGMFEEAKTDKSITYVTSTRSEISHGAAGPFVGLKVAVLERYGMSMAGTDCRVALLECTVEDLAQRHNAFSALRGGAQQTYTVQNMRDWYQSDDGHLCAEFNERDDLTMVPLIAVEPEDAFDL